MTHRGGIVWHVVRYTKIYPQYNLACHMVHEDISPVQSHIYYKMPGTLALQFVLRHQYSCAVQSGEVAVVSPKFYGICYLCVSRVPLSMFVVNLMISGNSRCFCMLPL